MNRELEKKMLNFVDSIVARYKSTTEVYNKLIDFTTYLGYTEADEDLSDEFKKLFGTKILNAVVEGGETTFSKAYSNLVEKKPLNISSKHYSGKYFDFDGAVGHLYEKDECSLKESIRLSAMSSCGYSSSNSRCGSSSSSSCGSSRSSRSSCGSSTSSSSCGSSYGSSRC